MAVADSSQRAPLIVPRSKHVVSRNDISPEALKVLYRLKDCGFVGYLAGGGVRDLLLGRRPKDFDVATDATPNQMRKIFRNCRLVGRRFRLAHVFFGPKIVEVATFRSGVVPEPAAVSPDAAATGDGEARSAARGGHRFVRREDGLIVHDNVFGTPREDALRRDFTINALFYDIDGFAVIDYAGGLDDLNAKLVRCIGDPEVRYAEDPVRMIRAVRFASTLGFAIEPSAFDAIVGSAPSIVKASNARLYEEVLKVLACGALRGAAELLARTGLLAALFPDVDGWLRDGHEGVARRRLLDDACGWIDRRVASGRTPAPALMFVMFYGGYLEDTAAAMRDGDLHPVEAIRKAVKKCCVETAPRILIPRRIGDEVIQILLAQHRFAKPGGRKGTHFTQSRHFPDAFEYFAFRSEQAGRNADLVRLWRERAGRRGGDAGRERHSTHHAHHRQA